MRKHSEYNYDILEELLNARPEAYSTGEIYRKAAKEITRLRKQCQDYEKIIKSLKPE